MTFFQVISSDGVVFNISTAELACSKLLMRIAGDLFLVTKINLDNIPSEVLGNIHRFMKLSVNPPSDGWIKEFLEDCAADLCSILQASHFLEIDQLTTAISETIAKQIVQCRTVESMRENFGIVNDLTENEENAAKSQVSWAIAQQRK